MWNAIYFENHKTAVTYIFRTTICFMRGYNFLPNSKVCKTKITTVYESPAICSCFHGNLVYKIMITIQVQKQN